MDYSSIINIVFSVISTILGIFFVHNFFFYVVGILKKKKFEVSDKKLNYAILVAARNEEAVIGNFVNSVKNTDYPQEKLSVFVIAHNCTDQTAKVAREAGAIVYEYNNQNERTKGYALKYLIDQIKKDKKFEDFDGYYIFDADNLVASNYFDKMNDAFIAGKQENIVTSYRNSKNFGSSLISGMYGIYFLIGCVFEQRGRTVCGCSTRVTGTGYVVPTKALEDGWNYFTFTEDWEFTADRLINGEKVLYCDEAEFFDEQPTNLRVMFRQRIRWSRGHLLVFVTRFKALIKSIFSKDKKHKFSLYDFMTNILPSVAISFFLALTQIIFTLMTPVFTTKSFSDVVIGYLSGAWPGVLSAYLWAFVQGLFVMIAERKRIVNVGGFRRFILVLLWPLFSMVQIPIDVIAVFDGNCEWKVIPHTDKTEHSQVNKTK